MSQQMIEGLRRDAVVAAAGGDDASAVGDAVVAAAGGDDASAVGDKKAGKKEAAKKDAIDSSSSDEWGDRKGRSKIRALQGRASSSAGPVGAPAVPPKAEVVASAVGDDAGSAEAASAAGTPPEFQEAVRRAGGTLVSLTPERFPELMAEDKRFPDKRDVRFRKETKLMPEATASAVGDTRDVADAQVCPVVPKQQRRKQNKGAKENNKKKKEKKGAKENEDKRGTAAQAGAKRPSQSAVSAVGDAEKEKKAQKVKDAAASTTLKVAASIAKDDPVPQTDFLLDPMTFKHEHLMDYVHDMQRLLKSHMELNTHWGHPLPEHLRKVFTFVVVRPLAHRSRAEQAAEQAAADGASSVRLDVNAQVNVTAQLTINYLGLREVSLQGHTINYHGWNLVNRDDIPNLPDLCSKEFADGDDKERLTVQPGHWPIPQDFVDAVDWAQWKQAPYNSSRVVLPVKEELWPAFGGKEVVIVRKVWCMCLPALILNASSHCDSSHIIEVWESLAVVRSPKPATRGAVGAKAKARQREEWKAHHWPAVGGKGGGRKQWRRWW